MGWRGWLVAGAVFVVALLATGRARTALDGMAASREQFKEMVYLPRGNALKVIACGFDSPFADALFVEGMVYFGDLKKNAENRAYRYDYVYALFDVVTDLSPRFTRAYQLGSLFLTATGSPEADLKGCALLEKGVKNYDRMAAEGAPVDPDARWLFHAILANTYDVKIQTSRRTLGDAEGAAAARKRAAAEFRLGAASPGAPPYLALAAAGYESVLSGEGNIESAQAAVLAVWVELYQQAEARGDKDVLPGLKENIETIQKKIIEIRDTRAVEATLSAAGRKYVAMEKKPPKGAEDLLDKKLIPGLPPTPLATEERQELWVAQPDGTFKSLLLAEMETSNQLDILFNAVSDYRRANRKPPMNPQELVTGKFLPALPEPPLKAAGQEYSYDPIVGAFTNHMPEGLETAPATTLPAPSE